MHAVSCHKALAGVPLVVHTDLGSLHRCSDCASNRQPVKQKGFNSRQIPSMCHKPQVRATSRESEHIIKSSLGTKRRALVQVKDGAFGELQQILLLTLTCRAQLAKILGSDAVHMIRYTHPGGL